MANISANFTGADGALGSTDTGQTWTVLRGTVTRKGNRGFATNTNPGPFAVADASLNGQDATISCTINGSGAGGQAIYFRVVDATNWWRLSHRVYTEYYYTGGYTCQNRLNTGEAGPYEPSSVDSSGPYTDSNGNPGYRSCYANTSSYTAYQAKLEKCVAGTVTAVQTTNINAATSLKVVTNENSISGFTSNSATALMTVSDSTHNAATKHGFGYAETTQYGNSDGVDDFSVLLLRSANYVPAIML